MLYYISNAGKNQKADGRVNHEQYRKLVLEDFHNIADKFQLKFDLEFGGGEVTHIKWYHEDKWIRPVTDL